MEGLWCALSRRRAAILALVAWLCHALPVAANEGAGSGLTVGGVNPAIFEDDFCSQPPGKDETFGAGGEISLNAMDCSKLMEFLYVLRQKVGLRLERLRANVGEKGADPLPWTDAVRALSRGSSLLSAHMHVIAAISSQKPDCFSEHVRLLLIVHLRRTKALATGQLKQLWLVVQDGSDKAAVKLSDSLREWLTEASGLLDTDMRTLRAVLRTWRQPTADESHFYSHEADGRFSTMESLRRDTFDEWQLDKGLLQGLVRHVFAVDSMVADFGAGSGHYASWLNDTGLVLALAFDGSPDIELVTKGNVLSADLGRPLQLWRKFDWALCVEVGEHIPPDLTGVFLRNLDAHVTEGLVLTWVRPGLQGLGSTNPQSEAEVLRLVAQHTTLHLNRDLTAQLRATSQVAHLAESILVLVRNPPPESASTLELAGAEVAPGCAPEDGWIYAGNDVQMFTNVADPAACCELCRSNELCRFWTWSREATHKDLCWIKATREYRINHAGFVSGARP